MKKCKNCNVKYPDEKKFCKTCGEPLIEIHEIDSEEIVKKVLFDSSNWFRRNIKNFIGIIAFLVASYAVYFFVLRHDPIKDANKLEAAFCNCFEKYNEELIKVNQNYLDSLDSYNFKTWGDAIVKLRSAQFQAQIDFSQCTKKATNKIIETKARYSSNEEDLRKFLGALRPANTCVCSNEGKLASTNKEVDRKLRDISEKEIPNQGSMSKSAIEQQIQGVQDPSALPTFPQSVPQKK